MTNRDHYTARAARAGANAARLLQMAALAYAAGDTVDGRALAKRARFARRAADRAARFAFLAA